MEVNTVDIPVAAENQDIEEKNSDKVDYLVNDFQKLEVKTDDSSKHISMCVKILCPLTPEFQLEYMRSRDGGTHIQEKKRLLGVMNPNKFRTCEFLIRYHEQRNDKIIVFCYNLGSMFALEHYATKLNKPYINGQTSQNERLEILQNFKLNPKVNTIFVSGVFDASFDLPDVNVLIEVTTPPSWSCNDYEDQEDERLGPFIRPKNCVTSEGNTPLFYLLVSLGTEQVVIIAHLERYLASQGYVFKILTELDGMEEADLCYNSKEEQAQLLQQIVAASDAYGVKIREKQRWYSLAEMINIIKAQNQTEMKSIAPQQPLM